VIELPIRQLECGRDRRGAGAADIVIVQRLQALYLVSELIGHIADRADWVGLQQRGGDLQGQRRPAADPGQPPRSLAIGADAVIAWTGRSQRRIQQRHPRFFT